MGNKVLVIGIDSIDPKICNKLANELPNFGSLQTYSKLETTNPPETPVAWSAAATGCNPGQYGIFDFLHRDPSTYMPKLSLTIERLGLIKTEYRCAMLGIPFWKILNENGINTTIIRWPVTFPAEKIKGRMLSGLGVVDIKGLLNSYSYYTNEEVKSTEGEEKVVKVSIHDNIMDTYISGPVIRKGGELKDIRIPLRILLDENYATIIINEQKYHLKVKQWSNFIKVSFKVGFLVEVHGIIRIYIISILPRFKMYMSSIQVDPENQFLSITYPKDYGKELVNNIGLFYTLGMPEDTKAVTENKLDTHAFLEQIEQIEEERCKIFEYEFKRFGNGLFAFAFDAGDRLSHIFWKNQRENLGNFEVPEEIEHYYIEKDKFLGKILSRIDSKTKLIIFSDHGFSNFERQVNINNWLIEEGFMKIKSNNSQGLFDVVDWKRTQAYAIGFTSIYLNLREREKEGIVNINDSERLIENISSKLLKLKDSEKNVLTNIYKGKNIYKGQYSYLAPDIVLGFSPGYRMSWKSAVGGIDKEAIFNNDTKWRGDHLIDKSHVHGILFTNFKINKKNPDIMDIAPTVLQLFDIKVPDYMDGESLWTT